MRTSPHFWRPNRRELVLLVLVLGLALAGMAEVIP
jgi:hypothetical protein